MKVAIDFVNKHALERNRIENTKWELKKKHLEMQTKFTYINKKNFISSIVPTWKKHVSDDVIVLAKVKLVSADESKVKIVVVLFLVHATFSAIWRWAAGGDGGGHAQSL